MLLPRTIMPFATPLALLLLGSCQNQDHPPFAADGDGGAAAVVNPGLGVPNVSPGIVNPGSPNPTGTGGAPGQTIEPATAPGTSTTPPVGATTATTNPNATATTDPLTGPVVDTEGSPTSEPLTDVSLAPATLGTSGDTPSLVDVTSSPIDGVTTGPVTDFETASDTNLGGTFDLDGGAADGSASATSTDT